MAEPLIAEFSIQGIQEATAQIEDLEEAIGDADGASDSWNSSLSSLRSGLTSAASVASTVVGVLSELGAKLAEIGGEWERQAGIVANFSGNIDAARSRVGGLISDLDLMAAHSRATAGGLQMTADEFATLAVRASELAQSTGEDASAALQRLLDALVNGSTDGLRPFGVELAKASSLAESQTQTIAALTSGYESASAGAQTLGGIFGRLSTEIDNITSSFIRAIQESGALDEATDALFGSIGDLSSSLHDTSQGFSTIERYAIAFGATLGAMIQRARDAGETLSALGEIMSGVATGDAAAITRATMTLTREVESFDEIQDRLMARGQARIIARRAQAAAETAAIREQTQALAENAAVRSRGGGGRGGGSAEPEDPLAEFGLFDGHLVLQTIDEMIAAELELEAIEQERQRAEQERLSTYLQANKAKMEALEQERAEADADRERRAAQIRQLDEYAAKQRETQAAIVEGSRGVQQLLASGVEMLIEGNDNLGASFAEMLKNWLKTFAVQQAMLGAAAIAEAIGMAVTNTAGAATKLASAAKHFALAAVAGGASAAIPAGGASTAGVAGGANGGGASSGTGGGGGGSVVININSPVAEPLIGRTQERARVAAERRFGAG